MEVQIKKLDKNAVIPSYATEGSAGMDITATSVEYNKEIDCWVYHTGLSFKIPEGYVMQIYPRSSNRKTDCYLTNSVGILDSDYTGELLVCYKNRNTTNTILPTELHRGEVYKYKTVDMKAPYLIGDRIAQIIIMPYHKIEFKEVKELPETVRGNGGFGSTGK